jgi:hypothetical protein
MNDKNVEILKLHWNKREDGVWQIAGMKGLAIDPPEGSEKDFFKVQGNMELLTETPGGNIHALFSSFGPTDYLIKQSIVPVVAWKKGEYSIRCIGTASIISCSGYVMTACHVLLDPQDRGYGNVIRKDNTIFFDEELNMGIIIPLSPAYGVQGFRFFPFEQSWYWGEWKDSPLFHESDKFEMLTDIAICKISELPDDIAHQPLNLSLNNFRVGEGAIAFGYAEMDDIPVEIENQSIKGFKQDLFVSTGKVEVVYPENHLDEKKEVPTPGPCFDFKAKIPGKMSGGPILGGDGAVVRGVVSRSFSGERHAFGSMLGPIMHLPLSDEDTIRNMMESGNHGFAKVQGDGL